LLARTLSLLASVVLSATLGAQMPGPAAQVAAMAPAASAPLGVERTVPVATRPLPRGAVLADTDFQLTTAVVRSSLRSASAATAGWVTRRPISAGEPLVEPAVGPPALVTSGQLVSFIAEREGVRLSIRGTAASAGALGDRVWVRVEAGRRLRGVVTAPATVSADTTSLR
jgi:flagella basal body P-ring formation protein FlgA